MVVAGPEGFLKAQYRTFNIKGEALTPGDDFGMMREVLRRRFARLMKSEAAADAGGEAVASDRPDLILIDGGPGPVHRRPRHSGRARRHRRLPSLPSPRAPTATRGGKPSSSRAESPSASPRAIPRSISCRGFATRRIASRSAPIGRDGRRSSRKARSTRSAVSGRRASARSCTPSAPRKRFRARRSSILKKSPESMRQPHGSSMIFSTNEAVSRLGAFTLRHGLRLLTAAKGLCFVRAWR